MKEIFSQKIFLILTLLLLGILLGFGLWAWFNPSSLPWSIDQESLKEELREELKEELREELIGELGKKIELPVQKFSEEEVDFSNYCLTHNGEVTDEITGETVFCADGLMWSPTLADGYEWGHYSEEAGDCYPDHQSDSSYPACYACYTLDYAGFTDWYLPDKDTLGALWGEDADHLDCEASNCTSWDSLCCASAADAPYSYWSSTESNSSDAWSVGFNLGNVYRYTNKAYSFSVRCVRE
jgi:hypothetical protein